MLDRGQYGYLISRTALAHPHGQEWTLSQALEETAAALAAFEARAGKDFGALVRERHRQRGLWIPLAETVLPERPVRVLARVAAELVEAVDVPAELSPAYAAAEERLRVKIAEFRVAEVWLRLEEAERQGASAVTLRSLEAAYLHEVRTCAAARAGLATRTEHCMAEAWQRLEEGERQDVALYQLAELKEVYRRAVATYAAACALLPAGVDASSDAEQTTDTLQ